MTPRSDRTRVQLDSVGTPITADILTREAGRTVLEQPLPFLKLHTGVLGEDGRRGRIASVAIAVEGGIPRLRLELAHELEDEELVRIGEESYVESTLSGYPGGDRAARRQGEPTHPYALYADDRPTREVVVGRYSSVERPKSRPTARSSGPSTERRWRSVTSKLRALFTRPVTV